MITEQVKSIQGVEASRRATELRGTAAQKRAMLETAGLSADPEVAEKASRRRFTAEYKIQILREADACTAPGRSKTGDCSRPFLRQVVRFEEYRPSRRLRGTRTPMPILRDICCAETATATNSDVTESSDLDIASIQFQYKKTAVTA